MSLEAKVLCPSNAIRNPHLPHIMRLRAGRIPIHNILNRQRKHRAIDITCQSGWFVCRQYEHDGPHDIRYDISRDPAVIVGCIIGIFSGSISLDDGAL